MTAEQIEKFFSTEIRRDALIRISFKTRNSVTGIFIQTPDFNELKSKNFWRIVWETHIDNWKTSHDNNLAKIFNGAEITRLTPVVVK